MTQHLAMDRNMKYTTLSVYSFLSILHMCVCQYAMTASPTNMIINVEDEDVYFSGSFSCRNQLDCAQECFKQSHDTTFYYALFKRADKLCVCANNFDWRKIAETASGTNEVVRIGVREGRATLKTYNLLWYGTYPMCLICIITILFENGHAYL